MSDIFYAACWVVIFCFLFIVILPEDLILKIMRLVITPFMKAEFYREFSEYPSKNRTIKGLQKTGLVIPRLAYLSQCLEELNQEEVVIFREIEEMTRFDASLNYKDLRSEMEKVLRDKKKRAVKFRYTLSLAKFFGYVARDVKSHKDFLKS